jgi:hypothetical protein
VVKGPITASQLDMPQLSKKLENNVEKMSVDRIFNLKKKIRWNKKWLC